MIIFLHSFIKKVKGVFSAIYGGSIKSIAASKPPITFSEVTVVERTPRNNEVKQDIFYLVDPGNKPKWVMFHCPCGCGHVITLSMQKVHNPHWQLNVGIDGCPTLYPSIWQKTGCYSHFWLIEGRIDWCERTGNPSPLW